MAICITRQTPKRDPKFHQEDKLAGAGRSTKALLIIFRAGWDLRVAGVIRFL